MGPWRSRPDPAILRAVKSPVPALLPALFAVACAAAPAAPAAAPSTQHYAGSLQVTSPDGATPYGPSRASLVARVVDPAARTVVERVLDEGKLRTATLRQVGDTPVFEATDDEGSFGGTLTFAGDPWAPAGWTYALSMTDGSGRIEGHATLDGAGIRIEKHFVGPDGARKARITEVLQPITAEAYAAALRARLEGEAGAR